MKQKQVKAAANGAKATKKLAPPKKEEEFVEENEEAEEFVSPKKAVVARKPVSKAAKSRKSVVKEVISPKKAANKKATKVQKVVEEEPVEEEDDEEEVEQEEDDEEHEEDEEEQEEEDMEDEEDEQAEDENDDEEMEAEEDEEEDDDDEEQTEQPTIPSKVKSGEIPSTVQSSKIIHITKLPKKCKVNDVVKKFEKYGKIDQVHMVTAVKGSYAHISYKTVEAAKAALAANKKVKIHNSLVFVKLMKEKNRNHDGIHVRNLQPKTSEEELREHFKSCGDIEQIRVFQKAKKSFAFIGFKDKSADDAALKLHNSLLNGTNILVVRNDPSFRDSKWRDRYDENRTVILRNKQGFANLDSEMVNKLQAILSKCGEIESLDVLCEENSLAMVIYKTEEAAQKAFELNNKTIQNFEFELDLFENIFKVNNNTIFVSNLPKDCTEDDLKKCFSKAGEISSILLKHGCATIRFSDSDGYCKSFLYTESIINRQMIFVEPYSIRKHLRLKSKKDKGFKRGAGKGYRGFKSKKPKTE